MAELTKCAICNETGGRFRFRPGTGDWVHVGRCVPEQVRDGLHKNWPLVTNNIGDPNDGPMVIQNLQHLRRVEKEHSVSSGVYSYEENNW